VFLSPLLALNLFIAFRNALNTLLPYLLLRACEYIALLLSPFDKNGRDNPDWSWWTM
jgi:hypothetical protein